MRGIFSSVSRWTVVIATLTGLIASSALAQHRPAAPVQPIVPTTYFRTFSSEHPVLARIRPGDTVFTRTVDAGGFDEKGIRRSAPGNPLTGPFYIQGAVPGDVILVRLLKVRLNRTSGV